MSNINLPEVSVPSWAKVVPENVWKKNLIDTLNAKQTNLFSQEKNVFFLPQWEFQRTI